MELAAGRAALVLAIGLEKLVEADVVNVGSNDQSRLGPAARKSVAPQLRLGQQLPPGVAHRFQATELEGQSGRQLLAGWLFVAFLLRQIGRASCGERVCTYG